MSLVVTPKNCDTSVKKAIQQISRKLGPQGSPTFAGLTLTDLTASALIGTNASKLLESVTIGTGLDYTRPTISLSHLGIEALTDPGADRIFFWDDSASASKWLGMGNSIVITNVTLDTIQDIQTSASPTFVTTDLTGVTDNNLPYMGGSGFTDSPLSTDGTDLISTGVIQATDFAKTGWPTTAGVILSFDNASKVFTVAGGASAYYYIDGVKYTFSGNKTVDLDDIGIAEGLWYIYFVGATLTASQAIWSFRDEDKALVAILYWDATNNKEIFLGWETHTFHMDGSTHARLHYAGGARWETGLLVSDNEDDTVDVSAGDMWDEDLNIPITDDDTPTALFEQILSPAQLPIYYRDGASAWRIYETDEKDAVTDVGYVDAGDSDNLKWNDAEGGWSNETVGLNNYVAYYVVATNEQTEPVVLIMGQRVDNKLSDAKVNNVFSGLSLAGLPFQEMVVLARLILKDTATYTLEQVLDLRAYNIKGNITSPLITQHAGLGGLDFANAGHSGFQAQSDALDSIVALGAITDNEFIVGTGAGTYAHESGATVRTSLGLGTGDSPQFAGLTLTGNIVLPDDGTIGVTDGTPSLLFDNTDGRAEFTGIVTVSDYMSIADGAAQSNIIFHLSKHWEITAAGDNTFRKGFSSWVYGGKTGLADYTSYLTAISANVNLQDPNTQNWTNQFGLRGITVDIRTEGSTTGTITGAVGIHMDASFQDSMTVTNYYGIYHDGIFVDNNKLVNSYGIYLEDFNDALTLNYAIYTNAGLVHFGDTVDLAVDLAIAHGGTGQSTAQLAINALSAVSGATNEHVLTKDTGTGNAIWKAAAGGADSEKVKIDVGATADYIGAAFNDGVLRIPAGTTGGLSYTDGGNFVTLALDINSLTADTSPDATADFIVTYDDTASAHKKVLLTNIGVNRTKVFAYMGSTQSVPRLTWTKLVLDTEEFDIRGEMDTDTNYRWTADETGYYLIQMNCYISLEQADTQYLFRVYKNGDTNLLFYTQHTANLEAHSSGGGRLVYIEAGEYIELWVYHKHSSANRIVYGGEPEYTSMSITRIF
jgi:hypothetical protein